MLMILTISIGIWYGKNEIHKKNNVKKDMNAPYEAFLDTRSINGIFDELAFRHAISAAKLSSKNNRISSANDYNWSSQGPGNIGGRFNFIESDPTNPAIQYAGAAQGGLFKTTDNGASWFPIFDSNEYISMGSLTIDPSNNNTLWLGTGDCNISGNIFVGNGIYVSYDAGATWIHKGLSDQRIVTSILVNPTNSNIILAGTMGNPFQRNSERGLYRSIDGGTSWTQVLYINDSTGIISMVQDPNNSNTIFASAFNRIRTYNYSLAYGNDAGIYRSIDGGNTWVELSGGLPSGAMSRINLAAGDMGTTSKIYASYIDTTYNFYGLYYSIDNGANWVACDMINYDYTDMAGFGWYFGNITVNPTNANEIYLCGVDLYKSIDGGATWILAAPEWFSYEVHADKHYVEYTNSGNILIATDGGLYISTDEGSTWVDHENIPVSQFYHVAWNPNDLTSEYYYGGMQDNGTSRGNISNFNNWERLYGGDGFKPSFVYGNPNLMITQTQYCNIVYTDDGSFYPSNDMTAGLMIDSSTRVWDMQYEFNKFDPTEMYCGTNQIYKMNSAPYGTWNTISPILTEPFVYGHRNHYISAIGVSPWHSSTLIAGTADGHLWRTSNLSTWTEVTGTLPDKVVSNIKYSPITNNRVFVSLQGYRFNDNTPYIFMSNDNGSTWSSIAGDMVNIGINDIQVMPENDSMLVISTDAGIYATNNLGTNWFSISGNIPSCPVLDVEYDSINNILIAGTFARGMYTIPSDSIFDLYIAPIDTSDTITISIPNHHHEDLITMYPQPCHDFISVDCGSKDFNCVIYNSNMALVASKLLNCTENKIWTSHWTSGIYIAEIIIDNKKYYKKIIKQ